MIRKRKTAEPEEQEVEPVNTEHVNDRNPVNDAWWHLQQARKILNIHVDACRHVGSHQDLEEVARDLGLQETKLKAHVRRQA